MKISDVLRSKGTTVVTIAPDETVAGLLALLYDFFPVLALWFIAAGIFTLAHRDAVRGGWLGWLEFVVLWLIAGLYAVLSWRRGGQTIGMRAWRLRAALQPFPARLPDS